MAIGIERTRRQKEAGMGTHFTVGLASALFTCIGYAFDEFGDAARIAAQVVTGIGFLGAGIIFFRRESLHGLTTAAIIWCTAAIGMCCGTGMYILASVCALLVIIVQLILHTKPFKKHGQRFAACTVLQLRRAAKNTANVFRHNAIPPLQNHARGQSFGSRSRYTPQPKLPRGKINNFIENNEEMIP